MSEGPTSDPSEARRRRLADRWQNRDSADPDPAPAEASQPSSPPPAAAGSAGRGKVAGKEKLQAYVDLELGNAARNAWWHTRNQPEGAETFSEFVAVAVEAHIAHLAELYNSGSPFPERPRKDLPPGRPVRS